MAEDSTPKPSSPFASQEIWIGYIIRQERQRKAVTQQLLAGELEFGMSAISTLESGNVYANFRRTLQVLDRLQIEAGISLAAISAQEAIHRLLEDCSQNLPEDCTGSYPSYSKAYRPYLPSVADTVCDMLDQVRESW